MDKVAAYQSGVVEGLRSLNLPQEVKLAAAQYLLKVAREGDSDARAAAEAAEKARVREMYANPPKRERGDLGYNAERKAQEAFMRSGVDHPTDVSLDPAALSALLSGPGSEDYGRLATEPDSVPTQANIDRLADLAGQADGEEAESLENQMSRMIDSRAGIVRGLDEDSAQRGIGLNAAQRLLRDNPGLALAAGLGTAGLGYGAYRALS